MWLYIQKCLMNMYTLRVVPPLHDIHLHFKETDPLHKHLKTWELSPQNVCVFQGVTARC